MSKRLTKKDLQDLGITVTDDCRVFHKTMKRGVMIELMPVLASTLARDYYVYNFYHGKQYTITRARILYAWFYGEIKANHDIIHLNGNFTDDTVANLIAVSRRTRLIDNFKRLQQ